MLSNLSQKPRNVLRNRTKVYSFRGLSGILGVSRKQRAASASSATHPWGGVRGGGGESACKPGSVEDSHSSGTHVAMRLERPTRGLRAGRACSTRLRVPQFGLAPGGVYPAATVASGAVRSYRTISPLPSVPRQTPGHGLAVYFLWHFPWARAPQALPGTLPYGARTFLPARERTERLSGRLPTGSLPDSGPSAGLGLPRPWVRPGQPGLHGACRVTRLRPHGSGRLGDLRVLVGGYVASKQA
jgi:hypothetical protein